MRQFLLLRAVAPLILILAMPLVGAATAVLAHSTGVKAGAKASEAHARTVSNVEAPKSVAQVAALGMFEWMPLSLVLAFCFTPSVRLHGLAPLSETRSCRALMPHSCHLHTTFHFG